ncbi:BON domain-containing protein [Ramlibacter albus]|uniref:BON domain-containing protein n=1 Tax=Ramlibacter albus TaxID=2079448 RepID=A0A923M6X8_9BURK|nr:BON domain-containing protein [Ramlibacter albus]MBC5763929.1 BON domain-containing protein [Ramlibacter albus]
MKTDAQLKSDVVAELAWDPAVNSTHIGVAVEDGVVTLSGSLDSLAEKYAAEKAVRRIAGVRGITNSVTVKGLANAGDIREEIAGALARHAKREATHIAVDVDGGVVTLTGEVDSLPEHDAVVGTAFAAKGVSRVVDRLHVVH